MYNSHRGMATAPSTRLTELLDQVRAEFENVAGRTGEYEHTSTLHCTVENACHGGPKYSLELDPAHDMLLFQ